MNDYTDATRGDDRTLVTPSAVDQGIPVTASIEVGDTDETTEIRVEIEQTRAELSETINAIQDRLNPQTLVEQAKDSVRETATGMVEQAKETVRDATIGKAEQMVSDVGETARGTGSSIIETIRRNPVPAALAAAGIGWLWMNRAQGASGHTSSYRTDYGASAYPRASAYGTASPTYGATNPTYGTSSPAYGASGSSYQTVRRGDTSGAGAQDAVRQTVGQVQDKAGQLTDQAQSSMSDLADKAQSGVSQIADSAQSGVSTLVGGTQQQAQRAQGQLQQMLQETPLAVGGIALALGAAVGLAIPETPPENQLMGEARDTLVQKAQETAVDTMHKVQDVAKTTQDTVQNVQGMAQTAKDTVGKVQDVAQKVGSAVDTAKDQLQGSASQ